VGWYAIAKEIVSILTVILQYKHFLYVLDDPLLVSIFTPTVTISPNFCSYGEVGFYFYFLKDYTYFDLMSCGDGVVGIVESVLSVVQVRY